MSQRSPQAVTSPTSLHNITDNSKQRLLSPNTDHNDDVTGPDKERIGTPTIAERDDTLPQTRQLLFTTIARIAGGWALAVLLAIGHHIYLSVMDGQRVKNIPRSNFGSQLWIKTASTAFSRAVVLALGLAAGDILVQMAWRSSAKRAMPISKLDRIFELPSFIELPALLFSSLFSFLLPMLFLVLGIQALELVSSIAPNALQIVVGPGGVSHVSVPSLHLSEGIVYSTNGWDASNLGPSAEWSRIVQRVMLSTSGPSLNPPANCSYGCDYTIRYSAPALQCHNLTDSELTLPLANQSTFANLLYNGTSTLNDTLNDLSAPYSIRLEWLEVQFKGSLGPTLPNFNTGRRYGVGCQFRDANYSTSMKFNGTSRSFQPTISNWGSPLSGLLANQPTSSCNPNITNVGSIPACWVIGMNYRATAAAFANVITGSIIYDVNNQKIRANQGLAELLPIFNISSTRDIFSNWQFQAAVPDVASALESMFTNVTLGLIDARDNWDSVDVTFERGPSVWSYDPSILWATYGPALLIAAAFAMYGLWCIWDGGVVDSTFSDFIIATRGVEIDRVCESAADREALKQVQVQYRQPGRFEIVRKGFEA